jgi:hypothetical protein
MRKIVLGLGLFSAFVFLSGMDKVPASPPEGFGGFGDDPSICDGVTGNLVGNCGFELNVFPPWMRSGDPTFTGIDSGSAHSGNLGLDTGPVNDLGFISQMLATGDQGAMHHLSFWLLNLGGTPNRFQVSWEGNVIFDQTNMPAFDYTRFDFDVFACGNTSELKFGFLQVPSFFHFDDVVVVRSAD